MGNRNSGRRPKPTPVLKLQGTYAPGRHADRGVELAASGEPTRPAWLKGEALKFWKRVVPQLVSLGVAKEVDTDALAAMATWWAAWRKHSVKADRGDTSAFRASVSAWDKFVALADRFGLSPTARIRLSVPKKTNAAVDTTAKYFAS